MTGFLYLVPNILSSIVYPPVELLGSADQNWFCLYKIQKTHRKNTSLYFLWNKRTVMDLGSGASTIQNHWKGNMKTSVIVYRNQYWWNSYNCCFLVFTEELIHTGRNLTKKRHGNVHSIILRFTAEQKEALTKLLSCEFREVFKSTYLQEPLQTTASCNAR